MILLEELQKKVEDRISNYIEFDIKELFEVSDYITIYGGSVRDSIAGMEIHDVDILCMPESANKLRNFLLSKDYTSLELYRADTLNLYKDISLISEPWTLINSNKKIIQIIRPRWYDGPNKSNKLHRANNSPTSKYQLAYYNLIKNVDISCCGVFLENFDRTIKLRESCKDAIINCITKTFVTNNWSELYNPDRTRTRVQKLVSRGWFNFGEKPLFFEKKEKEKKERLLKISKLEFKPEVEYKIWTEEEYLNRKNQYDLNELDDALKLAF